MINLDKQPHPPLWGLPISPREYSLQIKGFAVRPLRAYPCVPIRTEGGPSCSNQISRFEKAKAIVNTANVPVKPMKETCSFSSSASSFSESESSTMDWIA